MALILEGSDHSPVMWGKIGGYVIQRTKTGRMLVKLKVIPRNPRTPLQQEQRSAMREGVLRWKNFEKLTNKAYWSQVADEYNFTDAYRAFLSSFLVTYRIKLAELGDHTQALDYMINTLNTIVYQESSKKKMMEARNKRLIQAIFAYRATKGFMRRLKRSLSFLKLKGWLDEIRFGLLPGVGIPVEDEWEILGIIPPYREMPSGFGTGRYGRGTFGNKRI